MSAPVQRRVNTACQRCRKQKLRCDDERPCTLCIRAGAECVPRRAVGPRARRSRKPAQPREGELVWASKVQDGPSTSTDGQALGDDGGDMSATEAIAESSEPTWLDVANKILEGQNSVLDGRLSFALPGSGFNQDKVDESAGFEIISIASMLDFELPPRHELDVLLDIYFTTSAWFIIVLYEPQFRKKYVQTFGSGLIARSEVNFLRICFMVFAISARVKAISSTDAETSAKYHIYRKLFLRHVEMTFVQMLDNCDLYAVQVCILYGSCLTYDGSPRAGYTVLGTGVACARAIGLFAESKSKDKQPPRHVLEDRRRTWWALEIVDKFDSVKTGRPPGINDMHVDVAYPADLGDLGTPPGLPSLMSYHHQKFALYRLFSPALSIRSNKVSVDLVKTISRQAKEWESKLPQHLQWESGGELTHFPENVEVEASYLRQLRWQALALHTSYSNLMIILHRPFMANAASGKNDIAKASQARISRRTIFEVALRMSNLKAQFPQAMADLSMTTHAATLCGIGLFTAGVVLSCVALANPGSNQAHEAKGGIQRIISIHTSPGSSHVVMSVQSAAILRDLVRFIMEKETAYLLSPDEKQRSAHKKLQASKERTQERGDQDARMERRWSVPATEHTPPPSLLRGASGDNDLFSHGSDTSVDLEEMLNENSKYGESLNDVWQLFSRYDGPNMNLAQMCPGDTANTQAVAASLSNQQLTADTLAMPPPSAGETSMMREPFDMAQSWLWWDK